MSNRESAVMIDLDWPLPHEPVVLRPEDGGPFWAKRALEEGNAAILARYLRETPQVDREVFWALTEMLSGDPANGLPWRLRFRRTARGRPASPAPTGSMTMTELAGLLDPGRGGWRLVFERQSQPAAVLQREPDIGDPILHRFICCEEERGRLEQSPMLVSAKYPSEFESLLAIPELDEFEIAAWQEAA